MAFIFIYIYMKGINNNDTHCLETTTMLKILMVGMGGFAGSVCRHIINDLSHRIFTDSFLPYGTIIVNVIGVFSLDY